MITVLLRVDREGPRVMLRLPVITEAAPGCRLPFRPIAAERLIVAYLAASPADRAGLLADLLAGNPPLLLWTLARAWHQHGFELRTLLAAANWLAEHGLGHLSAESFENPAAELAPPDALQCDLLAQASLQAAARAEERAGSDSAASDWLLGCLLNAPEWLAAGGAGSETEIRGLLPPWLDEELKARDLQAATAAQADEPASDQPDPASPGWSGETGGSLPDAVLGELLGRLARLEVLESRFAAQLEEEKLLAMKELAYGAGHEINNPLANIATRAQTLLRDETDPERRRKLATINSQAFRAHEMIADMMLFAHPPRPEQAPTELRELVGGVIAEWQPQAAEQGTLLVHRACEQELVAEVDANQVAIAVAALLRNALEALGLGGQIEISTRPAGREHPGEVEIAVADTGPGIPTEVQRHMFEPFYSGREAGRGLGFGLSKAWRIAQLHGGTVEAGQSESGGARLVIRLPYGGAGHTGAASQRPAA